MPPDPFLRAHIIRPFIFDIGGRLSPISIRDQMLRGQLIVDRALEAGYIDGYGRDLLVVGAGAAGATAAIHAAGKGVSTWLIEQETGPFYRQANCSSRWVDPTQYDWPQEHWSEGKYPWTSPRYCFNLDSRLRQSSRALLGAAIERRPVFALVTGALSNNPHQSASRNRVVSKCQHADARKEDSKFQPPFRNDG